MTSLTRRRRPVTDDADETKDESTEAPAPRRRSRSSEATEEKSDRPTRRGRRSSNNEETPSRSAGGRRGSAKGGFAAYHSKRKSNSKFADEFRPSKDNEPALIKLLDAEPFDIYNQHWIEEGNASGKTRHSFVCYDDPDYFPDAEDKGCPLCAVGDNPSTYSLWNVINLDNPRKPVVEVWKASGPVTEKLERMAESKRTTPLDREDLYLEVTRVKKGRKTNYDVEALKAEDAEDEYEFEAFTAEELADFAEGRFTDRSAVTQVDDWEDLDELAESL